MKKQQAVSNADTDRLEQLQLIMLGVMLGMNLNGHASPQFSGLGKYSEVCKAIHESDGKQVWDFFIDHFKVKRSIGVVSAIERKIKDIEFDIAWRSIRDSRKFTTPELLFEAMQELMNMKDSKE